MYHTKIIGSSLYLVEEKLRERDLDLYRKLIAKEVFDPRMYLILIYFPLKPAKRRLILKSNDRRVLSGILNDHLMRVARIVGIPNVYIQEYLRLRKQLKFRFQSTGGERDFATIDAQEKLKVAISSAIATKAYPGAIR